MILLLLVACDPRPCGPGPEAWDPPAAKPDPDDAAWLFDPLHHTSRIDLTLDADAVEILRAERPFAEARFEVPGHATIDGEEVGAVGLRLRGGLGSFQRFDKKPEWRIDFNEVQEGRRFYGLEALDLNNADEDPSYLADVAGMAVYALAGSPTPRVGYAQLFVNGEDKGLYILVEDLDDRWLKRAFGEDDGNLYDGSYRFNTQDLIFLDLGEDQEELFDLEEGTDVNGADLRPLSRGLRAVDEGAPFAHLADRLDLDAFHALLAAERVTGNEDGYATFRNNYRIYLPPNEAPAVFLPWDMGATFPADGFNARRWDPPKGNLAAACLADRPCAAAHREAVSALRLALDDSGLRVLIAAIADRIGPAAAGDPWGTCDPAAVRAAQRDLLDWL